MLKNAQKDFIRRHIGPTEEEQKLMLQELGYKNLEELIANTVPAELAALLPIPLPGFIPLCISISNPKSTLVFFNISEAATPATLSEMSLLNSKPVILFMNTPFLDVFLTVISSPILSRQTPKISKPHDRLAMLAGEKILISFI